jgi:hypothetical protein
MIWIKILINILRSAFLWFFQFLIQLIGILLGIVIIPLALIKPDDTLKSLSYKNFENLEWWKRTLPSWAKPWDNIVDGTLGDDDFRWAGRDIPFGLKNTSFLGQLWWMAIRNPFNYTKRFILSCDVRKNKIEKLAGQDHVRDDLKSTGWQFLKCGKFYTFYGVFKYPKTERALVIQIGNKFDLEDNNKTYSEEQEYKYFKGFTTEVALYKFIGE